MTENALATLDLTALPSTSMGDESQFDKMTEGGEFLARLQLYSKGAPIDQALIRPGRWGIPTSNDDEIIDLGPSIDVLPLARRLKALDTSDRNNIIAVYGGTCEEFKRISAASTESNSNCMAGPSFLFYERSQGKFLEWFCGNKSSRVEAKNVYDYLPLTPADIEKRGLKGVDPHGPIPMTLSIKYKTGKFNYHVPVVGKCSQPFTNLPDASVIIAEINKFVNPKSSQVTAAPESQAKGRRAT